MLFFSWFFLLLFQVVLSCLKLFQPVSVCARLFQYVLGQLAVQAVLVCFWRFSVVPNRSEFFGCPISFDLLQVSSGGLYVFQVILR